MREVEFEHWLRTSTELSPPAQINARSRCKRVEKFEGNLDDHFAEDQLATVLSRLEYSKEDEAASVSARHSIPMAATANIRNGNSSLANAVRVYVQFSRNSSSVSLSSSSDKNNSKKLASVSRRPSRVVAWPDWEIPREDDQLTLARLTTPYIRFLAPEIVYAIVEDNERQRTNWGERLMDCGINPISYLWERTSCGFPGIRRHAGSKEIAQHRKLNEAESLTEALVLDDNHYPKSMWSFLLRGGPFQNLGPKGYALAHLADHKAYKNRGREEFKYLENDDEPAALFGLFTCASNMVYLPTGLIRPTDFNFQLRNLLQRRAQQLYGEFCNLTPPHMEIFTATSNAWSLDAFVWAAPVGDMANITTFLEYRSNQLEKLFLGFSQGE